MMDSSANFVNAAASGEIIPCSNCGKANKPTSKFCTFCGTPLARKVPEAKPAFAPVTEPAPEAKPAFAPAAEPAPEAKPAFAPAAEPAPEPAPEAKPAFTPAAGPAPAPAAEEPVSVFAQGLPDWDIVPPHVMVRRR